MKVNASIGCVVTVIFSNFAENYYNLYMNYIIHLLKCYPVSCFYILVIWILCFASVPHTPLDNVSLIDKWVHTAMYLGTCGTIWLEYLRRHKRRCDVGGGWRYDVDWRRLFVLAWLAPVLMSGLIEVLQATCTGGRRSGEWLDFAANSIGVTLAAVVGIVWMRLKKGK